MSEEMTKYNGGEVTTKAGSDMSTAVSASREMAEVQASIFMARQLPRDEQRAVARINNACGRSGLAETAIYQYARGGQNISGASIRLAETIAINWQNLQCGVRELEQKNGESTCEAFAWDVENNVRVVKSFKVSHVRHTRLGSKMLTDPRDIYEAVANQGARRVRACILAVVPGDVVEDAINTCEQTLKASADTTPAGLKKIIDTFAKIGVTKKQLEKRIQRNFETITAGQIVQLRKVMMSIKDGMSNAADWFDAEDPESTDTPKKKTLKDAAEQAKEEAAAKPEPKAKPATKKPAEAPEGPEPVIKDATVEGVIEDDGEELPY